MVMRRDFLGGAGLLAGLFLAPPALAAGTSKVTSRVVLERDEGGDTWLVVYLTNHGPDADDVRSDSGHAVLKDDVTVGGQPVWVMQEGMMSRGGPRLAWTALPVGKEVQAGRYWTEVVPDDSQPVAQQAKAGTALAGTIELTLRSGPLVITLGEKRA